jgi:NADH-quinone oxidoreductase subunit A
VKPLNLLLLAPPLAFLVMLGLAGGFSWLSSLFAARGAESQGKERAYACGQNVDVNKIQPDYAEFFPVAFFFTIMHVAALIIATAPKGQWVSAVLFVAVALLALKVLFRSEDDVRD